MKKWSLKSIILGGGIALFVPLICYFILRSTGHTGHIIVPKNFGIDTIIEKTVEGKLIEDTLYHTVADQTFTSHLNKQIRIPSAFPRKILVLNFINTTDSAMSDKMTYHMRHIQEGFRLKKRDTALQVISLTINPEVDDVSTLRKYADKHSLDHDTWTFLTGDKQQLIDFGARELFIDNMQQLVDSKTLPSMVLLDKYHNIRGYYNGQDSMAIKACIDDIALLLVEKNKIHEKKK